MKKQKACSFFVSDNHLLTIILPYINEKMNEGKNVNILSQKDLTDEVKKYLKSVKKFDSEKILKLCWKNKKNLKNVDENTILFIIGDKKFVKNIKPEENIETVECYKIENMDFVKKVAEEYDYYLRTDGILKIIKNSQKGQNSNTVTSQL